MDNIVKFTLKNCCYESINNNIKQYRTVYNSLIRSNKNVSIKTEPTQNRQNPRTVWELHIKVAIDSKSTNKF